MKLPSKGLLYVLVLCLFASTTVVILADNIYARLPNMMMVFINMFLILDVNRDCEKE
jgi:hypothetical protein